MVRNLHISLAILAIWLAPMAAVRAGDGLPGFPRGASYVSVREALIRSGFQPIQVFRGQGDRSCKHKGTPCYPELIGCGIGGGSWLCDLLFERRSDGLMLQVTTYSDGAKASREPAAFNSIHEASLYDLVIATADGKGRQEICTPPPALVPCSGSVGACRRYGLPGGRRPPATICEDVRRATQGLPTFAHTPNYRQVKAAMGKIGFAPEPVATPAKHRLADCGFRGSNICAQSPEVMACSASLVCDFLFRRQSDGRAAVVELDTHDGSADTFWLESIRWPNDSDRRLYGDLVALAKPSRHHGGS